MKLEEQIGRKDSSRALRASIKRQKFAVRPLKIIQLPSPCSTT